MASIARRVPYFAEQLNHEDMIDLKQLKKDMKVTNVNRNEEGHQVKWNKENCITWMRFEKEKPSTILYKLSYDKDEEFKQIHVLKQTRDSLRRSVSDYTLPKAYTKRLPISKEKLKDLRKLCEEKTIPSSHHRFYEELEDTEGYDDLLNESDLSSEEYLV